ncbi:amino acid ABC transporter ATP-binding protein [Vallitalea okinawensis]|uniref:amino acid ABC transporter ATP-binding protein n=1 Tax=Vallitalea okinawensis TaxID=2078660 RepID=UPI000CFC02C3|nr:amino acid ABC transporter ATP-binding protein [Vallitalea okinawensis]
MLKIKGLNKSFGDLHVLDHLDLEVNEGEVVAIIGSSGSGKSTLLRSINYLEKPDSGELILNDIQVDFNHISPKDIRALRQNTAMVFQSFALFRNKTALQNILEPLIAVQKKDKHEALVVAKDLLNQVGLDDKADHYPSQLSGGQKQRVGIARAMACNPKILLFDEPTSALDPELVKEVLGVISNLAKQNKTMIIVTHEMKFAEKVADRIIFLDQGKVAAEGSPEEIFGHHSNKKLRNFISGI